MAKKISDLSASSTLTGAEYIEVVQGGASKKAQLSAIKDLLSKTISFTTAIPFDFPTTEIGAFTGSTAQTFTVNSTGARSGCGSFVYYTANGGSNTPDLTAFEKLGSKDFDTTNGVVNLLVFIKLGSRYLVAFDQPAVISGGGLIQLNAPTSFAAGTPTSSGCPFTWADTNSSPNEFNFQIQIATDSGFSSIVATINPAANATSANATGLSASTLYYARIRAKGDFTTSSDSNWSSTASFTTASSSGLIVIDFPTNTGLNNASGVWNGTVGGFGNTGLSDKKLPASTDGYILTSADASDANSAAFGFSLTNAQAAYNSSGFKYGFSLGGDGYIYYDDNGSIISSGVPFSVGDWIQLIRTSGTLKIRISTNSGSTWTDVYTFGTTSTADLFIVTDIYGSDRKLYHPKGFGIV